MPFSRIIPKVSGDIADLRPEPDGSVIQKLPFVPDRTRGEYLEEVELAQSARSHRPKQRSKHKGQEIHEKSKERQETHTDGTPLVLSNVPPEEKQTVVEDGKHTNFNSNVGDIVDIAKLSLPKGDSTSKVRSTPKGRKEIKLTKKTDDAPPQQYDTQAEKEFPRDMMKPKLLETRQQEPHQSIDPIMARVMVPNREVPDGEYSIDNSAAPF